MRLILDLFLTFMRIGGFTFGGGYAMIPMLEKECVEKKKWATSDELMDYYAIAQCTPGVIAINTATFIGYKVSGVIGSVAATIGVITPSWVIITIIALFLKNFASYEIVQHAVAGITIAVFALVFNAVIKLGKKAIKDKMSLILCVIITVLAIFTDISAFWLIIIAGVFGVIYTSIIMKSNNTKENTK